MQVFGGGACDFLRFGAKCLGARVYGLRGLVVWALGSATRSDSNFGAAKVMFNGVS